MNEVYDSVLGQVLKVQSSKKVVVKVEQGKFSVMLMDECVGIEEWFVVLVMDAYTMQLNSYMFTSKMSDDELENTLALFNEKICVLNNLNYPT